MKSTHAEPSDDYACLEIDLADRMSWNIGSDVLICSSANNQFVEGNISKIYNESNGEWLEVKYQQNGIKKVQRFSSDIKPSPKQKDNTKQKVINHKKDKEIDSNQIFCWYPSDARTVTNVSGNSKQLYLRKSPYTSPPHLNVINAFSIKDLLKFDEVNNIYYIPVGIAPLRLQFSTSHWVWPKQYTMIMWIKWKKTGTIATFDSSSYTPIYGSGGTRLGCVSGYDWKTIDNYSLVLDKWQYVIVFGGNNKSRFYIGDLVNEPKFVGEVGCDIGGHTTYRIGNSSQGPGNVGCIVVYDEHKPIKLLIELYYESILQMGDHWTKTDAHQIKQILINCLQIHGIVLIVFELIFGRLMDRYEL